MAPLALWYWPIEQLVQAEDAAALEKLPGSQGAHDADEVDPVTATDVPVGQLAHVDDAVAPDAAE